MVVRGKKKAATSKAKAKSAPKAAPSVKILPPVESIKGFNSAFQCRGFQFEVGKSYSVSGKIKACANGFHACPVDAHPLSVFDFYPPAGARYAIVEQAGVRDLSDTKLASASITIKCELSLPDLVARAIKYVFDRANWKDGPVATGANEGVTASGTRGAATASGTRGAATASGDQGAATASGTRGAATASGDQGAATASGYDGRVKGAAGNALFAVERNTDLKIMSVACGIVGKDRIEPDVWYLARDGKLVAA